MAAVVTPKNKAEIVLKSCEDESIIPSNEITINVVDPTCLKLNKTTSCSTVFKGKEIQCCVTITDQCAKAPFTNVLFKDVLDPAFVYVPETFTFNGSPVTPTYTSNTLTYLIPTLSLVTNTICFKIKAV